MECDDDGLERAVRGRGLKRKLGARAAGVLRLAFATAVPRATVARPVPGPAHQPRTTALSVPAPPILPPDPPFMSNMDEISYWIYTKRAPCLLNYDNIIKKQAEQAQCSTTKPPSVKTKTEEEPSPRKKRKLKLLDDNSGSSEKQQNIYFKTPQTEKPGACKSDSCSDSDFIVKNSPMHKKPRAIKGQRNCQSRVAKKTKISSSTPKAAILRRSLRKAQQNFDNSNHNTSFEIFNVNIVNGKEEPAEADSVNRPENKASNDRSKSKVMPHNKGKTKSALNGQFEDLSDVSGFTANYIRSTKIHSAKRPQNLRNQNSRALAKHTKHDEKMLICQDKSVNTGNLDTTELNCSTDSSQNALNLLVTVRNNDRPARVNQSTSLLKFVESKLEDSNANSNVKKQKSKNNLNISFQSRSSAASRYPRRCTNNTANVEPNCSTNIDNTKTRPTKRYNKRKGTSNLNQRENSNEPVVSRTRNGRRVCKLNVNESDSGQLQLNSSTEHVSPADAVNVACPNTRSSKRNNTTSRCLRSRVMKDRVKQLCEDSASEGSTKKTDLPCALEQSTPKCVGKVKKTMDRSGQSLRDSMRDKSGFAACFSDSDSDIEPLKQKKFFC